MKFRRCALLVAVSLAIVLAACGGKSSSTPPPQISIAFAGAPYAPPTSMTAGGQSGIAAVVTNGPQNAEVSWSVTCGNASQCGTFSPNPIASNVPTTYTAPTTVPSQGYVTVTATSANDSSATVSAKITINQPVITVTFTSTPPSSLSIGPSGNTANLGATANGDPQNLGVTWSVTCLSAQCGGFSNTSALGATTTYTAPSVVPSGGTVKVTATSVADANASVSATIQIGSSISISFPAPGQPFAPPTSMLIAATAQVAAIVSNDPNPNGSVNWTVTCATTQCGSFNPTSTVSGYATTYSDPTMVPIKNTVILTATSVDDYTKSAEISITITSNIVVAFTTTPTNYAPPSSMNTNMQVYIAAYTTNDPNNAGVNWSVSCGSTGQCGSFDQSPTGNNATTLYTAPLTIPAGTSVTVTATSVSDFNQSKSASITITQPPTTLPDGTYVFQLSGEDSTSPFNVAGAFIMQSGVITGGEQDFVDASYPGSDAIGREGDTSSTTINTTADGNLQIVLDTSDGNIGVNNDGLETLNVTLITPSTGLVTWFDGFATGSGTIALQDSAAAQNLPKYGYAFLTSGTDGSALAAPVAIGGVINIDDLSGAGTISGNGSVMDMNDGSATAPEPGQPLAASTVAGPSGATSPDSFGKVIFTLNPNANPAVPEIALAGYIIDSNTIALVETTDKFNGITGGTALAQGQSNTGKFGAANLSGLSYVVGAQGQDPGGYDDFVGSLTFNSDGSVSGTADLNDEADQYSGSGNVAAPAGSTTVDSTGRVTVSGLVLTDEVNGNPPLTIALDLYLDGNGNAVVATMDLNDITAGPAFQQAAGASFSGNYALGASGVSNSTGNFWSAAGPVSIGSGGAIGSTSFTDFNYFDATMPTSECGAGATSTCAHVPLTGTVSSPSSINGLGADSIVAPPLVPDTFDFYVIDSLRAFGIETDAIQLGLLYFQQAPADAQVKAHK